MIQDAKEEFLILHANCIPVKGLIRSIICDLQYSSYHFIPNDLYDILTRPNCSIQELILEYGSENKSAIDEYIEFIINENLGFIGGRDDLDLFPRLNTDFRTPSKITNAILEYSTSNVQYIQEIAKQLELLGCKDLQIVAYDVISKKELEFLLTSFENSIIKSLELIIPFNEDYSEGYLKQLLIKNLRISRFHIHSANEEKVLDFKYSKVFFFEKKITSFCKLPLKQNCLKVEY